MYSFRDGNLEKIKYSSGAAMLLTRLDDFRGQQAFYERPEVLEELRKAAVIQSTEASNSIEGIVVGRDRLKELMDGRVSPDSRSEAEIEGYRDALDVIHASAEAIPLNSEEIQRLHGILMKHATDTGGKWKSTDNRIEARLPTGEVIVSFDPIPAWQTADAMSELCTLYQQQKDRGKVSDLVLIAAFALDFLCVHPFSDGNGRMVRLLILLLLYHSEYDVGRFISIEKAIEETRELYYESLRLSSQGWHVGEHDLLPWLDYFLTVLLICYIRFAERVGVDVPWNEPANHVQ